MQKIDGGSNCRVIAMMHKFWFANRYTVGVIHGWGRHYKVPPFFCAIIRPFLTLASHSYVPPRVNTQATG